MLSANAISYISTGAKINIGIQGGQVTCFGAIDADGSRFLIGVYYAWWYKEELEASFYIVGDDEGMLRMLVLIKQRDVVKELKLEPLGPIATPSSISYIDDGVVYVGSLFGDSQVSI